MNYLCSLKFNYVCNFPIKSNLSNQTTNLHRALVLKTNDTKKIFCKNFIIFIVFLKFLKKVFFKKSGVFIKYTFFIKPNTKNIFNFLKAPYKNKLSRNQLYTPRYKLNISIYLYKISPLLYINPHIYVNTVNFFKKNLICLESNLIFLDKVQINFNVFLKNYWNYF